VPPTSIQNSQGGILRLCSRRKVAGGLVFVARGQVRTESESDSGFSLVGFSLQYRRVLRNGGVAPGLCDVADEISMTSDETSGDGHADG